MVALAQSVIIGQTTYLAGTDSADLPTAIVDLIRSPAAWVGGAVPALSAPAETGKPKISAADLTTPAKARAALGLGTAAVRNVGTTSVDVAAGDAAAGVTYGTTSGTAAQGNDARITGAAQKAANLADLASTSAARTILGLGGAAVLDVGTSSNTVAAGNDARIVGAAQKAANLSDLASASTARSNLGLGGAAVLNVGTSSSTVAAGDAPAAVQTAAATDATTKAAAAQTAAIGAAAGLALVFGGI